MKRAGIIGGLGPMAMVYFLQLITEMTDAKTDQEHMELLIHSKPQTPDRTRFILGKSSDNPFPFMMESGKELVRRGAEFIAIPCITAHFFQKQLEEEIGCPILHAIEETAGYLRSEGIERVGLMATDGTLESKLFQSVLERYHISCITPGKEGQKKIMHLIYQNVKAGKTPEMDKFRMVSDELFGSGAQVLLLGCTELSLIKKAFPLEAGYLDVLEVLARKTVQYAGAALKEQYQHLITQ